ncbi:zinc finger protein 654-like [Festucalex cinctus]
MADGESDIETDGLELALESLCSRYCSDVSALKSKDYCSGFCELVEAYTSQWQVPLPQLKVLRTALCGFTKATAKFPDDCQHVHNILSRLALSIFELLLFFSKEEFGEKPLKDILDSYQACHVELLRYRNVYLQHAKLIIKAGGPWANQVLQAILKEAYLPPKAVDDYLSSELPVFLELRIRYLQACERIQEAMALARVCLENHKPGKHLFLHQAYLTCLYKASLHEHLHKQMAKIDGRDAVEIICNTERDEKDELLLSLCKVFLAQQLHNGNMYYIWDLVFIWSRLQLRVHPSKQDFLTECTRLASSATNVRAIFPFIKLITTELGGAGVQVCMELCTRALQLCDAHADDVAQSLVCKTIGFLLPGDLEICRACALLVFCLERSLEAYQTVRLLYKHPDQESHPHRSLVPTNVRFKIMQMLKEHLSFDPEFWSILALRNHCLELIDDKVTKDAFINEMGQEEEEEEECCNEELTSICVNNSYPQDSNLNKCTTTEPEIEPPLLERASDSHTVSLSSNAPVKKRKWGRGLKRKLLSDEEIDQSDDPEYMYNLKPSSLCYKSVYSLRRNHTKRENCTSVKLPLNRKREYLSRCVKSQILKRKGKKKRWLQGLPRPDAPQTVQEKKVVVLKGKKRGRKPAQRWEVSYPDNEISLPKDESGLREKSGNKGTLGQMPNLENEPESAQTKTQPEDIKDRHDDGCQSQEGASHICAPSAPPQIVSAAVEADPELDGPLQELLSSAIELMHNYHVKSANSGTGDPEKLSTHDNDTVEGPPNIEGSEKSNRKVKVELTWREKLERAQKYGHLTFSCKTCKKNYKGLNVLRHCIAHLKRRNRCIICGKCFQHFVVGKKHIWEHIEEMCKNHKEDSDAEVPKTTNGPKNNPPEAPGEKQTPSEEPRKLSKVKVSTLSREDRIIRNIRIAIRKMLAQSKNKEPPAALLDFEDEQVVIQDNLVVIKAAAATKEDEADAAGENGNHAIRKFVLCPSATCDRVFLRHCNNLTKHAVRCHLNDDDVLEKTFIWAKHKCTFCGRNLQFFQYYKEHLRRHDPSLPHFCFHAQCDQRFLTAQELKAHMSAHDPFSPVCAFANCDKRFSNLISLFDHEWRHYVPPPQRDDLDRQQRLNIEAPWKQRVKIEETWSQAKRAQSANVAEANAPEREAASAELVQKPVNGFEEANQSHESKGGSKPKKHKKKFRFTCGKPLPDPLNIKEVEKDTTMAEGADSKWEEPVISQHKSFNPQDPAYAPFYKTPFTRLPPCTYMDESQLSMRKRRLEEERAQAPSQTCTFYTNMSFAMKNDACFSKGNREAKVRYRCEKCLSSFDSVQELQKHKNLNTCSALFGFDSDDES